MKVLLIEPSRILENANIRILGSVGQYKGDYCWPPLDLTIIAGILRKNGIDSDILDANAAKLTLKDVKNKIKKMYPDVIIFSTSTSTISKDIDVAKVAKDISKKIITVAIGTHVAALPVETLKSCKELDIVVWNPEPEMAILNLLINNLSPYKVSGVCYRRGRSFVKNSYRKHMNLDDFDIPAHDKVDASLYSDPLMIRKPMALTYTSRGCRWGKCIYCCNPYFYKPIRFRSISLVIKELKWLNELGIKEVKWFDPEFNNNLKHTSRLCDKIIKENIDITWSADMRVDMLPMKLLKKMKKAGCHTVLIGVESGDSEILKNIHKGITLEQVRNAVRKIRQADMHVITHFLLGLPGENKETMMKTLQFAKELNPDATTFGIVVPHPGTEFHDFVENGGFFITRDYNKFDTSSPPVYDYPQLSSKEIYNFMKYAYRDFYFRPSYITKRVLRIRSVTEFQSGIANFQNLIRRFFL